MQPMPPRPEGWNRTWHDLMQELHEGRRASISGLESAWAGAYERSLLPPGTRIPHEGEVFECTAPFETELLIAWNAPVTTGVRTRLPVGTRIRVAGPVHDTATAVSALALDPARLEKAAVPWWTRWRPDYGGCHLVIGLAELNRCFRLDPP